MKNWRTTTTGIFAILVALINAAQLLIDDNPNTNPDWNVLIPLVAVGIGNILAKDSATPPN